MGLTRRFRAVPWLLVLAAIQVLYEHWQRLERKDRERVTEILRHSRGLPHKMSTKERSDLVDIARRFDHIAFGRDLASTAAPFPVPGLKSRKPT